MLTLRHCSGCRDERHFERPPCTDAHGLDCPEEMCVECGSAIVVGDLPPALVVLQTHAA